MRSEELGERGGSVWSVEGDSFERGRETGCRLSVGGSSLLALRRVVRYW